MRVTTDGKNLVSHAGTALLSELADRSGLTEATSGAMAGCGIRWHTHDPGVVLTHLAVAIADGADCLSDLAALREQSELFGPVASIATAWRAVAIEATGPNSSDCSRRDAMSARQSAPSAMATARWVRTTPGSWVCHLIPQPAMAPDIASVKPLRSASSDNNAVPACDTRFFPSVVTLIDWVARLSFTFKESS